MEELIIALHKFFFLNLPTRMYFPVSSVDTSIRSLVA